MRESGWKRKVPPFLDPLMLFCIHGHFSAAEMVPKYRSAAAIACLGVHGTSYSRGNLIALKKRVSAFLAGHRL